MKTGKTASILVASGIIAGICFIALAYITTNNGQMTVQSMGFIACGLLVVPSTMYLGTKILNMQSKAVLEQNNLNYKQLVYNSQL